LGAGHSGSGQEKRCKQNSFHATQSSKDLPGFQGAVTACNGKSEILFFAPLDSDLLDVSDLSDGPTVYPSQFTVHSSQFTANLLPS
jgi:hypothetical protein